MPTYTYNCGKHEFELLVPRFEGSESVLCEEPDEDGKAKLLTYDGETIVCGRWATRQDDKSVPARRNPDRGIQR